MITNQKAVMQKRIINHISQTIAEEGSFKIDPDAQTVQNFENWQVTIDTSIMEPSQSRHNFEEYHKEPRPVSEEEPKHSDDSAINSDDDLVGDETETEYSYQGIEVISPVFEFSPKSLEEVKRMCNLLTKHYRLSNNGSTGLHVHLGHGNFGFRLPDLKRLSVFLYTFEPQLSSLHPQIRYHHYYGGCMRHNSRFTFTFQRRYKYRPSPQDFSASVTACKDREIWYEMVVDFDNEKYSNYSFRGVKQEAVNTNGKPTIEFRQHEGTMDGVRIAHWIKTIVGIATYVENANPAEFLNFLKTIWKAEKWEKRGDGQDVLRAAAKGPILADKGFTIIDLLRHMGLDAQADYYNDKWMKHNIPRQVDFRDHGERNMVHPASLEYQRIARVEKHFDGLRPAKKST